MNTDIIKQTACFHPTAIVVVDENESLLEMLSLVLPEEFIYYPFYSPERACQTLFNLDEQTHGTTQNGDLFGTPFDNRRFNNISVIIYNQDASRLNGYHFLEKIGNHPAKRILFSNAYTKEAAALGMTLGAADQVILKHDSDVFEQLVSSITRLQNEYFQERFPAPPESRALLALLPQIKANHNLSEHYLHRSNNSALLVNDEGDSFKLTLSNLRLVNGSPSPATLDHGVTNQNQFWRLERCSANTRSSTRTASFRHHLNMLDAESGA